MCLMAKDGATQQLELQGELVRKMVSIQEEIHSLCPREDLLRIYTSKEFAPL